MRTWRRKARLREGLVLLAAALASACEAGDRLGAAMAGPHMGRESFRTPATTAHARDPNVPAEPHAYGAPPPLAFPDRRDCNGNAFDDLDGREADVLTDRRHCGGCNRPCSGDCVRGVCVLRDAGIRAASDASD